MQSMESSLSKTQIPSRGQVISTRAKKDTLLSGLHEEEHLYLLHIINEKRSVNCETIESVSATQTKQMTSRMRTSQSEQCSIFLLLSQNIQHWHGGMSRRSSEFGRIEIQEGGGERDVQVEV